MNWHVDYRADIDFDHLRANRLSRLRSAMAHRGLDAVLCFRPENTRYVSSLRPLWMPTWLFLNAAVVTTTCESPVVWVMQDDYPHRAEIMEWLPEARIRPFPGGIESSEDAEDTVRALVAGLSDSGFSSGRLGVDIIVMNLLEQLGKALPGVEIVDAEWCFREARAVKTPEELELMRQGCAAVDAAYVAVYDAIRPGVRETEVLAEGYKVLFRFGAEAPQSAGIVASGPHSSPMQRFASDRVIQNGDLVWTDIGGCYSGIFCEAARGMIVGSPSRRQREIFTACYETQMALFANVKAGVTVTELQGIARDILDERGMTQYLQRGPLLHGIGVGSAEPPWIPGPGHDYDLTLEAGMTLCSVPTLQLNGVPGGGGVRLEDQLIVGPDGAEVLTKAHYDERLLL